MTARPATAIVTGQIRDTLDLYRTLLHLVDLRGRNFIGNIVISTWFGEIDKLSGLSNALAKAGITVVESQSPPHAMAQPVTINSWMQMKMLHHGMTVADPEAPVFKLRTDKCVQFISAFADPLANGPFDTRHFGNFEPVLLKRTSVLYPKSSAFLHYRDGLFLGAYADIARSIGFDGAYDVLSVGASIDPETRFFLKPFYDTSAFVRGVFTSLNANNLSNAILSAVQDDKSVVFPRALNDILAYHYLTTASNFWAPDESSVVDGSDFVDLFTSTATTLARPLRNSNGFLPYLLGDWVAPAVVTGKLAMTPAYRAFMESVESLTAKQSRNFSYSHEDWGDFVRFIQRQNNTGFVFVRRPRIIRNRSVDDQIPLSDLFSTDAAFSLLFDQYGTPLNHRDILLDIARQILSPAAFGFEFARIFGETYLHGNDNLGIEKNLDYARSWLAYAATSRSPPALFALGRVLAELEEFDEAIRLLGQAARTLPAAATALGEVQASIQQRSTPRMNGLGDET